ncbi:DUF3558 domain-containing protein [Nocardia sp. NPDC057663]|uniref:DUF3558 domain-containing protein n=1 Tax=Nocardia sp. NPDC057663 TaxID=3346201 RepID=UPI00366D6489
MLAVALAPVSCATQTTDLPSSQPDTSSTAKQTFAAPVGGPPQQGRGTTNPVRWDPCVEVPDSTVSEIGFAPETRERSDAINYDYAFIGCKFWRREEVRGQALQTGGLFIKSANISLQQIRDREDEEEFTANGRAGVLFRDRAAASCTVALPGPDGVVHIMVGSFPELTDWDACDHIGEIVGAVETLIPN